MNAKESNTASLIDELGTPLVRYLARKVRNNEDANDLAQEAFLRMHRFQQSSELDNVFLNVGSVLDLPTFIT